MEVWVLILWLTIDRGGGPMFGEFTSKQRCEDAAEAVWKTPKYRGSYRGSALNGNHVCVLK